MRSPWAYVLLFVVFLALPSCSGNPEQAILGKWESANVDSEGKKYTFEFLSDGTLNLRNGGKGTYQWLDDGNLEMSEVRNAGGVKVTATFRYNVTLSGDSLTLREGDETALHYTRVTD